jgi:cysteine synthase
VPSVEGNITPDLFVRMEERVLQLQKEGAYWTRQFTNEDEIIGYGTLGTEIIAQLNKKIDVFCAAVGTGGMLIGVSTELKKSDASTMVIAISRMPPMLKKEVYDQAMAFEESSARETARLLAAKEGIFCGTSGGLNVYAAIEIGKQLGPGHTIVTVVCDSGMKYLAGDLFRKNNITWFVSQNLCGDSFNFC